MAAPKGNKNHLKHGKRNTRLYDIWRAMRQRCSNPKCINFSRYGGRGIRVCDEWDKDFNSFYGWSMENGYDDMLTLDRIDVNGWYTPENCRWASYKSQANNKTNNRVLEFDGVSHSLSEWSDITGISTSTIYARLKSGWSVERTLSEPAEKGKNGIDKERLICRG